MLLIDYCTLQIFNESFYAMLRRALCVAAAPSPGDKSSSTIAQPGEQSAPSLTSTGVGLTSTGGVSAGVTGAAAAAALGQHAHLNGDVAAAWRAFTFDPTTPNILGLHYGSSSRPSEFGAAMRCSAIAM